MSTTVFLAVLLAALLHAAWNGVVKASADPALETVLLAGAAGALSLAVAAATPLPAAASWPFIAASAAVHVAYFALVAAAYRIADLSVAYPLMRGSAPLLVALATSLTGAEHVAAATWLGIALVSAGVLGLSLHVSAPGRRRGPSVAVALANAGVIAGYTVVDGLGVRRSASPVGYTAWVFALTAVPLTTWGLAARGAALRAHAAARGRSAAVGAACIVGAYAIVLWAMTCAPIAPVAALRETSILFGVAIARLFLGEPVQPSRALAAASVAAGVVALRLAG